jgi:hypothetical protein
MTGSRAWLWLEVALCLPYAAVLSTFGLAMTAHWLVTTVFWGADIAASSLLLTLYAASTCLGIFGTFILILTQLGATASKSALLLTRVGLVAGFATSLLLPGGYAPETWYHDKILVLFAIVLPCVCFAHFAYLARRALFWGRSKRFEHCDGSQ